MNSTFVHLLIIILVASVLWTVGEIRRRRHPEKGPERYRELRKLRFRDRNKVAWAVYRGQAVSDPQLAGSAARHAALTLAYHDSPQIRLRRRSLLFLGLLWVALGVYRLHKSDWLYFGLYEAVALCSVVTWFGLRPPLRARAQQAETENERLDGSNSF